MISKLLEASKDVIIKYGHCKGDVGDKNIGFCMLGAIEHAAHGPSKDENIFNKYNEASKKVSALIDRDIIHFNDAVETTKEDILAKFDQAINLTKFEEYCLCDRMRM